MGRERIISFTSAEETRAFGQKIAPHLKPNTIIALSGELGAGKTTFVQGLALGLGIFSPITSPTFVYFNAYEEGLFPLFHFDLYRLKNPADFLALGFGEYLESGGICAIEWPERISSLLPASSLHFSLLHKAGMRIAKVEESWYSCFPNS